MKTADTGVMDVLQDHASFDDLVGGLRAIAEPTRMRILGALRNTELTVGELCRVLGQSQPRVSRHLKLLCDAGVLTRHAAGTSAFYRRAPRGHGARLVELLDTLIDPADPTMARDNQRVAQLRAERDRSAAEYFEAIAGSWDELRRRHAEDERIETALFRALAASDGEHPVRELLDIGTGTGRMLELFGPDIAEGIGIDLSTKMLTLARSRLEQAQLHHCSVRHGNVYDLRLPPGSVDVALLHQVLHFLENPAGAIAEAARTIRAGGRLAIVDFAPHGLDELRTGFAHRHLGFAEHEVTDWMDDVGIALEHVEHLEPDADVDGSLVVTIWVGRQPDNAPSMPSLEAAS